MPVDGSQPVYPPQTLTPITSAWGQAVSDSVVQKFASTTDRVAKWPLPPEGSLSTIVGSGRIEVFQDDKWYALGLRPAFTQTGPFNTNAGGDFAIPTGYIPTAVMAMWVMSAGVAGHLMVRDFPFEISQVVFRAYRHDGSVVSSSTVIASIAIFID